MRTSKPFTVYQPVPGKIFPRFLFTIHAHSREQAKAIVAGLIAGETRWPRRTSSRSWLRRLKHPQPDIPARSVKPG